MLQISAPTESKEVTQDASSIDIFPLGNGVSSEVRNIFIGDDHPSRTPKAIIKRFTAQNTFEEEKNGKSYRNNSFFSLFFNLPTNAA